MGQSFFSSSVVESGNMKPFAALTFVMGCAFGAPADLALNGVGYAGLGLAGVHGLGYAAAPAAVGVAAAAPAPYTTAHQGPGVTTVHQPAPVVTKQVHYGQTSYVSGYATKIHKPATPHLPIAVPTVLKGTQTVNAPIVKTQTEIHNVQTPVHVQKPYDAPYDAPFLTQKVVEVPTPVHVDAPYNVPVPVAVQGETIVKKTVAPAVVTHSHHVNAAAPVAAVAAAPVAVAGHAVAGYAAAPIAGVAAIH